jgi:hypothetical protein
MQVAQFARRSDHDSQATSHSSARARAPHGVPPTARARAAGPRPATYELIERITSLQLKMAPLDVLADGVVAPLLDAFARTAGGLLLYHSEDSSLRLIASRGLSLQGASTRVAPRRRRRRLGDSAPRPDEPEGLHHRAPHEHPFVPELIERDETRRR